jgi:hypothetical protein
MAGDLIGGNFPPPDGPFQDAATVMWAGAIFSPGDSSPVISRIAFSNDYEARPVLALRPRPMAVADYRAVNLGRVGDEAVDVYNSGGFLATTHGASG